MTRETTTPTNRPLPPISDEAIGYGGKPGPAAREIPWIDPHQHTQTLTWEQQEKLDIAGASAVVMIAASYMQAPYRPIGPDDRRALWDDTIRMRHGYARNHFFDVYIACGIHTGTKVEGADELLSVLPDYCALDETVAVGETGIDPIQRGGPDSRWPLEEQERVVEEQMRIADDQDLPVIIHTPASKADDSTDDAVYSGLGGDFEHKFGRGTPSTEPLFDLGDAKRRATEIDVELKDRAGLPDERLVLDHADATIVEYVLESTDCYLAFSLCHRVVGPGEIAEVITEYGPEKIMIDTDLASSLYTDDDAFLIRRLILDLLRLGIVPEDVRTVVYENPKEVFGLDYPD